MSRACLDSPAPGTLKKQIIETPQTQDVNWTYIRRSEDVLDVFWTSYVRSIYVLCLWGKEETSLTWIACYSLSQLKLLSMALELMLSLLILLSCLQIYFLLIIFKYMLMYISKGYAETFLHLRKWLAKSTLLNQSMQLPLRCALRYLNSEADIANARWHPSLPFHSI